MITIDARTRVVDISWGSFQTCITCSRSEKDGFTAQQRNIA
jgi:hypothetical protein